MDGRTDERTDGRTDRHTDGRTDGRTNIQTDGRTDEQTYGRTDERANGRMDKRTDGRTNKRTDGRLGERTDGGTDGRTEGRTDGLTHRSKPRMHCKTSKRNRSQVILLFVLPIPINRSHRMRCPSTESEPYAKSTPGPQVLNIRRDYSTIYRQDYSTERT